MAKATRFMNAWPVWVAMAAAIGYSRLSGNDKGPFLVLAVVVASASVAVALVVSTVARRKGFLSGAIAALAWGLPGVYFGAVAGASRMFGWDRSIWLGFR